MLWMAIASLLLAGLIGLLLMRWIGWLRGATSTPRWVLGVLRLGTVVPLASGAAGTMYCVLKAYGAVSGENVDPTQKFRILEVAIADAMNCNALGMMAVFATMVPLLLLFTWRQRRSRKTP